MVRAAIFSLGLAALLAACSDPPKQPNLLLIAVDTLRADHLGTYGHRRPTSPEIDAFFDSAVTFEEAHSSSSWTLPAFASLMTSLYSSTHGCTNTRTPLDDSFETLAERLSDEGFHTAGIVSHTFLGSRYGLHQGFEDYDESLVMEQTRDSHQAITSPRVTEKALKALDRVADGDKPWFVWVHYFDPHRKYLFHEGVSDPFVGPDRKDIDLYDGEIAFTDAHIGQLLRRLEQLGLADDTVVAFVSDHGEAFKEHGWIGHGKTLYRLVERVPFALRVPGVAPRRVSDPVSVVDFMPTVLELLDVQRPSTPMVGRSLVATMSGASPPERGLLMELRNRLRKVDVDAFLLDRWKLILEYPAPYDGDPIAMLFDWAADPREAHDLSSKHPEVVEDLTRRLQQTARIGRQLAKSFTASGELELSPEEIERLRQLGYVGDDK